MGTTAQVEPAIAWDEALGGWTVSCYEAVRLALLDPGRFDSEGNPIAANLAGKAMLVDDSPVHDAFRALWAKALSPPAAAAWRGELEQLAGNLLAPITARLREGAVTDLVPLFESFTGRVVLRLLDLDGLEERRFKRWYKLLLDSAAFFVGPDDPLYDERAAAKAEVYAMLAAALDERQARLRQGEKLTDLIALAAPAEGTRGITRTVILDNLFNLFTGGADTTLRWMGNAIVLLYRNSLALAEIRLKPDLLAQALEEVMRIEAVTRFAIRTVRQEGTCLAGQPLALGDTIYLLTSRANHDPVVYTEPGEFDIHRRSRPHLGFSYGRHQCIGMHLARVEAQVLIGRILAELPCLKIVEVDYGDQTVVHGPQRLLVSLA
jgi:cytochrome P450